MKFLVVGAGSIGRRHFENLRALGFRDCAFVRSKHSSDLPQRAFFKKHHPRVYYDFTRALAQERPDAVFVCNPTSVHLKTAMGALRAGAHVFIEKPLAHSLAGVDRMLAEAKRQKKIIAVGYHFRYHPQLKLIKKFLDEKRLGKILFARFFTGEYLPGWHPGEEYRKSYAARKDLGGGVLLTQSHDLDALLWLFGKPKRVRADVQSSGTLGIKVDDVAEVLFECPRCPIVSVHLDYLLRPPIKYYSIVGTQGRVEWDYYRATLRLTSPDGTSKLFAVPRGFTRNHMYVSEMQDFIRSIRGTALRGANGQGGRDVLTMVHLAKEASKKFLEQ